jgi:hypothetical protein
MKSKVGEKLILNAVLTLEPTRFSKAASVDCRKKSPPPSTIFMSFQNGAIMIGIGVGNVRGNGDGVKSTNPLLNVRCPWLLTCKKRLRESML